MYLISTYKEFLFTHPEYEILKIIRFPPEANSNKISFKLILNSVEYDHSLYLCPHKATGTGMRELGYSDIDMPRRFQNKGISYVYHYVGALTAQQNNVEFFAVDCVASTVLSYALTKIGMQRWFLAGNYYGESALVAAQAKKNFIRKGWTLTETGS